MIILQDICVGLTVFLVILLGLALLFHGPDDANYTE